MADEQVSIEEQREIFLAAPDGDGLLQLYERLLEEGRDDLLAGILEKIRPIQHRITLIQADVEPELLEALTRDPHRHVREVVASHNGITEEVCFRLCEDTEHSVRLALRKNDNCHPVIRSALLLRERTGEKQRVAADHLLEISWQARRVELSGPELVELITDWTQIPADELGTITGEQTNLILDVLLAKAGKGPMPRKPRKRAAPAKAKKSARVKAAKKKPNTKKKAAKKKAAKKKAKKKTSKKRKKPARKP